MNDAINCKVTLYVRPNIVNNMKSTCLQGTYEHKAFYLVQKNTALYEPISVIVKVALPYKELSIKSMFDIAKDCNKLCLPEDYGTSYINLERCSTVSSTHVFEKNQKFFVEFKQKSDIHSTGLNDGMFELLEQIEFPTRIKSNLNLKLFSKIDHSQKVDTRNHNVVWHQFVFSK